MNTDPKETLRIIEQLTILCNQSSLYEATAALMFVMTEICAVNKTPEVLLNTMVDQMRENLPHAVKRRKEAS